MSVSQTFDNFAFSVVIYIDMISIIQKYFKDLTPEQISRFEMMGRLYPEWNEKINVISRKDIDNLFTNHILHSLSIAKFINPVPRTTFLDMGTGGGFPGLPLAVLFPDCRFHLIDRIGKKIKVASSIAAELGMDNVTFQHGDIGECRQKFDFVISRAVMKLNELVPLIRKNISPVSINAYPNGLICLKGGELADESKGIREEIMEYDLKNYFDEDFFETKKLVYVPL